MFAKFKLEPLSIDGNRYYNIGKNLYEENLSAIRSELDDYVTEGNSLSAKKIEDDWFPKVTADIFLSHSHADERTVIQLAGWLKEYLNVRTFVDSCVWAYCDDLINAMERKYNSQNDPSISRQICSHVYMILNTALHKMIDKTECLIFYHTPQSVAYKDYLGKTALYSPWIYSELLMGNLIQSKSLMEHRPNILKESTQHFSQLKVEYKICLDGYESMDADNLNEWEEAVSNRKKYISRTLSPYDSMDILYDLYSLKDKGYFKGKSAERDYYIG